MELNIMDPMTQTVYTVSLNEDDYIRAQNDINFATVLLNSLIKEQEETSERESKKNEDLEKAGPSGISQDLAKTSSENENQKNEDLEKAGPSGISQNLAKTSTKSAETTKTVWKYNETLALIKSMESHIEDLSHPKRKKYVFEHCENDLLSAGFDNVSAAKCELKWKSLVRSYTNTKDKKNKTGRGPSSFEFFDELDAILGSKPSNHCKHALDSGEALPNELQTSKNVDNDKKEDQVDSRENTPKTNPKTDKEVPKTVDEVTPTKRKRMNYEEYISEKRKLESEKQKRHNERMEIEKQKIANDKEKIALLKEFLQRK